jgi:hypothetical protein
MVVNILSESLIAFLLKSFFKSGIKYSLNNEGLETQTVSLVHLIFNEDETKLIEKKVDTFEVESESQITGSSFFRIPYSEDIYKKNVVIKSFLLKGDSLKSPGRLINTVIKNIQEVK